MNKKTPGDNTEEMKLITYTAAINNIALRYLETVGCDPVAFPSVMGMAFVDAFIRTKKGIETVSNDKEAMEKFKKAHRKIITLMSEELEK